MAVLHKAYTIQRAPFLAGLQGRCGTPGGLLDTARLTEWARGVAKAPSPTVSAILEGLGFDVAWLTPPSGQPLDPRLAFLVILAAAVEPAPGLSNRLASSYHVLEIALPILGWDKQDADRLRVGDGFAAIEKEAGIDPTAPRYMTLGRQYGWLRRNDARNLLSRLEQERPAFAQPSEPLCAALAAQVHAVGRPAPELSAAAHADALDMLRASQERNSDVLLLMEM
jgi:hypothetical protein